MEQVTSSDLLQAPTTKDLDAYSSSSSLPTPSSSHPMTSVATDAQQQEMAESVNAEVEAPSSTSAAKEKPPTPSRKSSLLATLHLAPPSAWRLRRASSVTKSNGKPTVDIRAAAISSPNLSTRGAASDASTRPTPITSNNEEALDDGDESDNDEISEMKSAPHPRGHKVRSTRSYSEASVTKDSTHSSSRPRKMLGSAIGSIKRRMGLKSAQHEDSRALTGDTLDSKSSEKVENEPGSENLIRDFKMEDGEEIGELRRWDTTRDEDDVPDKVKKRRSLRDSIRVKRESFSLFKGKPPTPDTFAFGASSTLYGTTGKTRGLPSTTTDEHLDVAVDAPREGSSVFVSSPLETNNEDVNAGASRQSLSSLQRPRVKHTSTAPSRSVASSIKSESGSVHPSQESSSQRKSEDRRLSGHYRHEHKHHPILAKPIPGHGGGKAIEKLEKLTALEDIAVPQEWLTGVVMIKISERGEKKRGFRIDPDQGLILWDSKSANISAYHLLF
jgi:hypothetical protein